MVLPEMSEMSITDRLYKEMIDHLPFYLSLLDREYRILFANRSLSRDYGDQVGDTCHETFRGFPEPCINCPVLKTFNDGKIHISEKCMLPPHGKQAQMLVYAVPFPNGEGKISTVMKLAVNIGHIKGARKELTLLGQAVASMSHGIKNILEGLRGGAYVVDEGIADEDLELIRKGWGIVRKNITEISCTTQNILYASKKRGVRLETVLPGTLVVDVVNLFSQCAQSNRVELTYEINPALPKVNLDPFSIRRMLNNLVSNAIEACAKDRSKPSHKIVVRADIYNELQFKFEVEDNGSGMAEKTKKHIFKEFYSTKGPEGTGLGLAVVQKIVKEHKGKIEVDSTPGSGSLFRIILLSR